MESAKTEGMRLRLIIGKYRVTKIENETAHVSMGNSITMQIALLPSMDVRPGDILTFYTEVPYLAPTYPTSKQ